MSIGLAGRRVVVTGGTGALGRAVVARLLAEGARVLVPTRSGPDVSPLADTADPGLEVLPSVDLADESSVRRVYGRCPDLWASIHLAGGFEMAAIDDTSRESWQRLHETNATSCFLCCREAVRVFRSREAPPDRIGRGRIVNVAAQTSLDPRRGAGMVAYAAAKAAVAAMTVALGEELAAEGIWVNAVAPSIIDTPANRTAMPEADHATWADPEEIAEAVAFLASPLNRATRGAVIPVYGRA